MELLKKHLKDHGINLQWLSHELNITYQALYVKLKGDGNFSIKQALKIKHLLRLTEEEFEKFFG